jgi:hypothetical protein
MIGRYSYPLVALGCPPTRDQPAKLRCCHGGTKWTDKEWLLLLAAAYQSEDPAVQQAVKDGYHHCLPWERLKRLRAELGITVKEQPQPLRGEDGQIICTCGYGTPCGCGTSVHYQPKEH